MATTPTKSPNTKLIIGIVVAIVAVLFISGLVMKYIAERAGKALLQGVIENQTGVKANLNDVEKGEVTFTDKKTGQQVKVGGDKLPESFPKDFPVYPGGKVIASVAGSQVAEGKGLLVTFTTPDGFIKVSSFFKNGLKSNGWTTTSSFNSDSLETWSVSKGSTDGSLSITSQKDLTTIQVMLENK